MLNVSKALDSSPNQFTGRFFAAALIQLKYHHHHNQILRHTHYLIFVFKVRFYYIDIQVVRRLKAKADFIYLL